MCGITLVISKKSKNNKNNTISLLMSSLEQLKNRGYDSFGLSTIINNEFHIKKMACLSENDTFEKFKNDNKDIRTDIAIGHTRWATHGVISNENAHPHISMSKKIVLVHNGIIENYKLIKEELKKKGYIFYSQTDSEVIVNLIDSYYTVNNCIEKSIKKSIMELSGTYGLVIQCIDNPDKIYIIRNGSPILIGENEEYLMATSESSGFVNQMKDYYVLKNNDLIILSQEEGINFSYSNYELNKIICNKGSILLTPSPYKHWTLREIYEQNESLLNALNNGARIQNNNVKLGGLESIKNYIKNIENIILLGCGTSLHACYIGSYYLKKYKCEKVNINVYDASEFMISDINKGKTLVILISQSGETMDIHRILPEIKKKGCLTMGIINVVDSLIAREVDCGIYMNAGKENAVASTKSFTSSLMILKLFSLWFYQEYNNENNMNDMKNTFTSVCQNLRYVVEQVVKMNEIIYNIQNNVINDDKIKIKEKILNNLNKDNLFILGKGRMEYVAREIALKLKEICYIHAESYSGSALKHGPFALLTENFPVILLIDKEQKEKMWNVYQEVKSRKAYCLVISELILDLPDEEYIKVPENNDIQEIIYTLILQHISYELSQKRGINPDTPRNLAKVVTVE